ncbi:MAG: tRNA (adenosine(37)-N6)-dimethylallyltransferase MiaA [Flavobacteriales bacterium]|nr:tRNA (adenosine(37)-N6)-dimethylallyltransferase MiaA [Flavobacteriales bacterium]
MKEEEKYKIIAVTGATASGKTARAIEIAREWNAEIVSFDSRQFYERMDIGTAKPTDEELSQAVHHFIGHLPIDIDYSIGQYEKDALECIEDIHLRGKNIVMVGGSGLYLQAVECGIDDFPDIPQSVREQVNDMWQERGLEYIQQLLKEKDPVYYERVDIKNPRRVLRALEVCEASGKAYSSFLGVKKNSRPFYIEKVYMDMPRELLYERIDRRVDMMMQAGLLEEVESLLDYRYTNAMQSVGYREFFDYFDGKATLEEAVDKVKQNSRNYAKRQVTWFTRH